MNSDKKPFHQAVAEKLIEHLKQGTAPWQKPWEPGQVGANLPLNPTTGKRYQGINALQLMSEVRDDQRWMTYKQAAAVDAQVRKGEKGTQIQYWKFSEDQARTDEAGKPVLDADGAQVKDSVTLERPRVFFATVFNAEQIDGLPPAAPGSPQAWSAVERAEEILQACGAEIINSAQDRAFYRMATDTIHLPDKSRFPSADNYYATALHELGHWSGHPSRLDRDLAHPFGSEGYAREELRAEIASMILGDELGIGHDPGQHAAYVGSWIKALQEDPLEIFRAAADAEKIQSYVVGLTQQQVQVSTAVVSPWLTIDAVDIAGFLDDQLKQAHGKAYSILAEVKSAILDGQIVVDLRHPEWEDIDEYGEDDHDATLHGRALHSLQETLGILEQKGVFVQHDLRDDNDPLSSLYLQAKTSQAATVARRADARQDAKPGDVAAGDGYKPDEEENPFWKTHQKGSDNTSMEVDMKTTAAFDGADSANEPAEIWTLERIAAGTIHPAIASASHAQLERILDVLADMTPVIKQNSFWQRHALPQDPASFWKMVIAATDQVEQRQGDLDIIDALHALRSGAASGKTGVNDVARFDRVAEDALGFTLPHDWTGRVKVQRSTGAQGPGGQEVGSDLTKGIVDPAWEIHAEQSDGSTEWVANRGSEQLAGALAERLAAIDAQSTINDYEKAVKLARINEERVRRDPDSNDEDMSAARTLRKNAEFTATANDEDLQRRIVQQERERTSALASVVGQENRVETSRQLIEVPFKQKDEVKALGAKWDRQEQSWYIPSGVDPAPFAKWSRSSTTPASGAMQPAGAATAGQQRPQLSKRLQYLAVPYGERAAARQAGAKWDAAAKSWFAGPNADPARIGKWKPDGAPAQQAPAMAPVEEFAEALKSIGCVIRGEHPIMDGKKHRITVEGEKFSKNSGAGFYVGHLDGHPAGYMKNNKTGVELTWKSKGYSLSAEQKASMAAQSATKLQLRGAELAKQQEQAATRVARQMKGLVPVETPTTYMLAKGIAVQTGALTDKDGKKTYLPVIDVDGKQWSMQYIQEDGTKRFAKDSRKEGCFHVVGGLASLAKAPALVISEGYATAATLKQSLGFATVSAFDSGNLAQVALALHQRFPDKPVVIAGDDDRHLEILQGVNPGRTKAEEAAALVGGKVVLPIFASGENSYPGAFETVTPAMYREHQRTGNTISAEQMAALSAMKKYTDFNDLAATSSLGRDSVDRQMRALVLDVVDKHRLGEAQLRQPDALRIMRIAQYRSAGIA